MDKITSTHKRIIAKLNLKRKIIFTWVLIMHLFGFLFDIFLNYTKVIRREGELFLGAALFIAGLFSFESDKYCDGNTADYLSCTRPTTYYYYDALAIVLLIVGVFFIMIWLLKNRKEKEME